MQSSERSIQQLKIIVNQKSTMFFYELKLGMKKKNRRDTLKIIFDRKLDRKIIFYLRTFFSPEIELNQFFILLFFHLLLEKSIF